MSSVPKPRLTPAEYLVRERRAEFKSEYFHGETFAMAGASREHNLIVGNLVREVGNGLKGRTCEVYPSDMRVKVAASGLYTYPDVTVVCGPPEFEDEQADTLLNPTVLFEVLSESTEAYDRGAKSAQYRRLASLQEYVLVAQDRPQVERYVRQPQGGGWMLREVTQLDQVLALDAISIQIPLAEIYRQITWKSGEPEEPARHPAGF
jgi:Uma2 family endonuclease